MADTPAFNPENLRLSEEYKGSVPLDPLDYIRNLNLFERIEKAKRQPLGPNETEALKTSGGVILDHAMKKHATWVHCRTPAITSVVSAALRGIELRWSQRHGRKSNGRPYDGGLFILNERTAGFSYLRSDLMANPPSESGAKLVVVTDSQLFTDSSERAHNVRASLAPVVNDSTVNTIIFSPQRLAIVPQNSDVMAIKQAVNLGFEINGTSLSGPIADPAIDRMGQYLG